jgi:hypothetical protein
MAMCTLKLGIDQSFQSRGIDEARDGYRQGKN